MTLYEKYKQYCPNSIVKKGELTDRHIKAIIKNIEKLNNQKKENEVPPKSEDELNEFERWKASRMIKSIEQLDDCHRAEITAAIDIYIERFGELKTVHLSGSYASGSYINESSSQEDRDIRSKHKALKNISDIDLIPNPFYEPLTVGNVEFTTMPKGKKVLVFKDGKIL